MLKDYNYDLEKLTDLEYFTCFSGIKDKNFIYPTLFLPISSTKNPINLEKLKGYHLMRNSSNILFLNNFFDLKIKVEKIVFGESKKNKYTVIVKQTKGEIKKLFFETSTEAIYFRGFLERVNPQINQTEEAQILKVIKVENLIEEAPLDCYNSNVQDPVEESVTNSVIFKVKSIVEKNHITKIQKNGLNVKKGRNNLKSFNKKNNKFINENFDYSFTPYGKVQLEEESPDTLEKKVEEITKPYGFSEIVKPDLNSEELNSSIKRLVEYSLTEYWNWRDNDSQNFGKVVDRWKEAVSWFSSVII